MTLTKNDKILLTQFSLNKADNLHLIFQFIILKFVLFKTSKCCVQFDIQCLNNDLENNFFIE